MAGIFSLDILYLEGKSPSLIRNNQVNFADSLPETSKSSGFWDMGVKSHLTWLLLFSPDVALANRTAPVYKPPSLQKSPCHPPPPPTHTPSRPQTTEIIRFLSSLCLPEVWVIQTLSDNYSPKWGGVVWGQGQATILLGLLLGSH